MESLIFRACGGERETTTDVVALTHFFSSGIRKCALLIMALVEYLIASAMVVQRSVLFGGRMCSGRLWMT